MARSKFGAALAEVAAGKVGIDTRLMDGEEIKRRKMPACLRPTSRLPTAASARPRGFSLTCKIVAGPVSVKDQTITLDRDPATGAWSCKAATVPQKLIGRERCLRRARRKRKKNPRQRG
jgi:type IV pilus assembly protein PilA